MTLRQAVRLYPKGIGWAAVISACCIMEGYCIALISNLYSFPPFDKKYGKLQSDGSYDISASWQAGISDGNQCGQIVGLIRTFQFPTPNRRGVDDFQVTGYGVEKFGYRPFMLATLIYMCIVITGFFCAPSVQILLVSACLAGVGFGVFMSSKFPKKQLSGAFLGISNTELF